MKPLQDCIDDANKQIEELEKAKAYFENRLASYKRIKRIAEEYPDVEANCWIDSTLELKHYHVSVGFYLKGKEGSLHIIPEGYTDDEIRNRIDKTVDPDSAWYERYHQYHR